MKGGTRWGVEPAQPLAALRIAVAFLILISPELHAAPALAADPFAIARVPEGLGLLAKVPIGPALARALEVTATSAAACAILGYWSRLSLAVLTATGGLAFSLSQYSGAVIHDMHLFWLSALLAVSRSGDVWSLDAWGRPAPGPSRAYGVPLACARALLGVVYLFPGVHKLSESGLRWLSVENVTRQLHHKWVEFGEVPAWRVDQHPALLVAGAVGVLAFELGFGVLSQIPRTRLVAAAAGGVFHAMTQLFFFIPFPSLWGTYVMLLPLGRASARASAPTPSELDWPRLPVIVGMSLLLFATVQGVRGQTQAWPFACYPTFAYVPPATIDDLAFEATRAGGAKVHFSGRERGARDQLEWRRVYYLTGAYGDPPDPPALLDFARRMAEREGLHLDGATRVVAFREVFGTSPEQWGRPVARTRLVELTPP